MSLRKLAFTSALAATLMSSVPTRRAEAGPLIDWLFHRRQPAGPAIPVGPPYAVGSVPVGGTYASGYAALPYTAGYLPYSTGYAPYNYARTATPYTSGYTPYGVAYPTVPSTSLPAATLPATSYMTMPGMTMPGVASNPSYGTYYGANNAIVGANGYGYMAQRPQAGSIVSPPAVMPSTLPSTMPAMAQPSMPAPVTLVPDYRTTASRTPVTYYRPILTTDPSTGAQVVTLAPCSSYEYQTQRVPTWGLTQVYNGGASLPAVGAVAPATTPTYSLPRGGVPLSGPMPSTQPYTTSYGALMPSVPSTMQMPSVTQLPPTTGSMITPAAPYSAGYGGYASNMSNYSTLQPQIAVPQSGTYSTTPMGGGSLGPYYNAGPTVGSGSTGGGSTGSYNAPLSSTPQAGPYANSPYANNPYTSQPGLTTSPLGSTTLPPLNSATPGVGTSPVLPPSSPAMPGAPLPGSVYPPSSDPAAGALPSFPSFPSGAKLESKPQLQNVVQQPMPGMRSFNASPSGPTNNSANRSPAAERSTNKELSPGLMPIPVPDDFQNEPRWNPGLLKEQDTTANNTTHQPLNSMAADPQIAWGSKTIHWASFTEPSAAKADLDQALQLTAPASQLRDKPAHRQGRPATDKLPNMPANEERLPEARSPEALGLKLVPGNQAAELRMVPIPANEPNDAARDGDRLELSPAASSQLKPIVPAQLPAAPNSSRYPTGGWKSR